MDHPIGGSVGANRASFSNRPLGGATGGAGSMMERMPGMAGMTAGRAEAEDEVRVWRPFTALNAWYTFSPKLTVGLEADAYPHSRFGEYLWVDVEADGFLYNMVGAITGTLYQVGRGHWPEAAVEEVLNAQDRTKAGPTAPPEGLFLMRVVYAGESEAGTELRPRP